MIANETRNKNTINSPVEEVVPDAMKKATEENIYKEDALAFASRSFKEKLAYKTKHHKNKIADMNPQEKRSYILQYFKWYFIVTLLILVCFIQIGKHIYTTSN